MERTTTYQRTPSETEMERGGRGTYESAGGYAQQTTETGAEQPSLTEKAKAFVSGRTPEEQERYDRSREYTSETGTGTGTGTGYGTGTGTGTGYGTGTGTGSLADSMRSDYSSRPSLQTSDISKREEWKQQPTTGEKVKAMVTGRTAEEQARYDREREREREQGRGYETGRGYEQGRGYGYETGRGYEHGRGTGTGTGREQPTIVERVEATFSGRSAQEQHEHDARIRHQREMERGRPRGGSSEPGLMSQIGGAITGVTGGMFGSPESSHEPHRTFKQKMHDSIHEIRTNLTGRTGETSYTPMERSSYTGYTGPETRHGPRGSAF